MSKTLNKHTRILVYGGDNNEKKAYILIGYDTEDNDSVVDIVRGDENDIPRLLKKFGAFTNEDIVNIINLGIKDTYWADDYSQIIRIS